MRRISLPISGMIRYCSFKNSLSSRGKWVVMRGTPNHDSESQFEMLKTAFEGDGEVKIITEPQVVEVFSGAYGWVQVACLPGFDRGYYRAQHPGLSKEEENEVFTKAIADMIIGLKAQCKAGTPSVLVSHYTITGCNMESGQTAFFSQFEPVVYEELKKAFSQDGIPHNIIRSIIPVFEATATNILGQMSQGRMSVEFVTEKALKSNSKKEVTTLDIIINDSDTGRLPYMSRSGGERVKAALSVILALSEIKSSKAGVQLGFLFIDEPPFLDAPGVQAYCDALEAIQQRYGDLKVMAITHDPAMKSRFPQSVDVVKTPEGSKVIYE